jgi:hypothetical protein
VFIVERDGKNLNQMVEAITRNGFVMAQEFLPAAKDGDTRFFMVNGEPLVVDGNIAALRRVSATEDFRSNMSAGGKPKKARVTDRMLELASIVGPKLKRDGIFFAGLDIVGDKIVEINTISTGGLNITSVLEKTDFPSEVIRLVARKVEIPAIIAATSATSSWPRCVGGRGAPGCAGTFRDSATEPVPAQRVQIGDHVPCLLLGDAEIGHRRGVAERRGRHDPAHHCFGLVRQVTGDVYPVAEVERRAEPAVRTADAPDLVTRAAAVAAQRCLASCSVTAEYSFPALLLTAPACGRGAQWPWP